MNTPQQVLLRDAMRQLNMTRDAFAERIGSRRRALDAWLLPDESNEFRAMPEVARRFVSEILASDGRRDEYTQSAHGGALRQSMAVGARITCCRSASSTATPSTSCSSWPT